MQNTFESDRPVTDHESHGIAFPVVGIGASAGGLAALIKLFEHVPATPDMAFVVVLHLSPEHTSNVDAILQRVTTLPVSQVVGNTRIEVNHVYVIPPSKHLVIENAELRLTELSRPQGTRLAIDVFFRSLARAHRARAIAVVLSGTGSDGSQGLRSIKEHGGVSIVQSPADAEYDMMPLNAIATDAGDFILPAVDIGQKLIDLWDNARRINLPSPPADLPAHSIDTPSERQTAELAFRNILNLLSERTTHNFRHYKRATVMRRIERRMQVTRCPDLPAYHDHLRDNHAETAFLLQDMLISVTNFFREADTFDALQVLMKPIVEGKPSGEPLRAWVAGCATGEEAYSVAIVLTELARRTEPPTAIQLFASDIDTRAIGTARAGIYAEGISADVSAERLANYFQVQDNQYRIAPFIREHITFSVHDLLRDPPFSRMDLVCCRNLLIYLNRDAQRQALRAIHYALQPHGVLFLGSSETADVADDIFTLEDRKHRLYRPINSRKQFSDNRSIPRINPELLSGSVPIGRERLIADIHQQLIAEYGPPSAMIDQDFNLLHVSPRCARFLRTRVRPHEALTNMVLPPLRSGLREALTLARRTGQNLNTRTIGLTIADKVQYVTISVHPLRNLQAGDHWMVVMFNSVDAVVDAVNAIESIVDDRRDRAAFRASFRPVHEADAEELHAANEELQSVNEELRSATEELETSKEELQSVNEELLTVNQELRSNIDETTKANDDLTNLIAANDIATIFVDADLHIKRFTPRAASVFNVIASDVGRPLFDLTHRLEYDNLAADARQAFSTLGTIEREVRSNDGRWYLVRMLPYRTIAHHIDGVVLNFIDISGRRRAEEELRAGEARLRLVAESTEDFAIITLDSNALITGWNKAAEKIFGYDEAESLGEPIDRIFTLSDRRIGAPAAERRGAREEGSAKDERWHLRKDGTLVYCSGVMTSLPADEGGGFAKIARDLTQTKRVQEQREALLESERFLRSQLETANRQKDEFLAVVSHELKNPLNLIALNADLLQRLPETRNLPSVVHIAEVVRTTVNNQAQIINELLDLSRIQTGKMTLNRAPAPLNHIVSRVVDAVRQDAERQQLNLELEIPDADFTVDGDVARLEQVVWNLVSNALKFTPHGGSIRISLTWAGPCVEFSVVDSGRGFEPSFAPNLFDMFSQADSGVARREGGLGIGLALTRKIVELHGGSITGHSPGTDRGATFTVRLPAVNKPTAARLDGEIRTSAASGLHILVVDDHPETLQTFSRLLEIAGAFPAIASSAQEALAIAESRPFDLLLSDLAMPAIDGYTLLQRMRAAGFHMPAVAVSGMGRAVDRERALQAGFVDLVGKPVDMDVLLSLLSRLRVGHADAPS